MNTITIDETKCTHCGLCLKDCISQCIEFDGNKFPKMVDAKHCISCQHCLAICPTGALTFNDKSPDNSEKANYDTILNLIKSRKSIRQYQPNEIDESDLNKIKEMLPYIPTGCNSHSLHFSIVESKSAMDKIRNYVNKKVIKVLETKAIKQIVKKFGAYLDCFLNGEDIIFRNAPHMIVVSSPINAPCAKEDPIIALSYIELYAQQLGLGTCWCGFAQICIKLFPKLSDMLQIPEGYIPVYTMLLGKPAIKYTRTTQPEKYQISSVKEIEENNSSILKKTKRFIINNAR